MTKIIDRHIVAEVPASAEGEGFTIEHHLLMEPSGEMNWKARIVALDGTILAEPAWAALPGSQALFLQVPVFECLYYGTRGPGKTMTILMDYCKNVHCGHGIRHRGILMRPTFAGHDDAIMKIRSELPAIYGPEGDDTWRFHKSKSEYSLVFATGETLLLRHMQSEDDYSSKHGHQYTFVGFEELGEWATPEAFISLISTCRTTSNKLPARVRATSNTFGPGQNWIQKRYQLPQKVGQIIDDGTGASRMAILGTLAENFVFRHRNPSYNSRLLASTEGNPAKRRAWLHGGFHQAYGGMYDDIWNSGVHVIPAFALQPCIQAGWEVTRSYDHGTKAPYCYLLWVRSNGRAVTVPDGRGGSRRIGEVKGDMFIVAEKYGCVEGKPNEGVDTPATQIAEIILNLETHLGVAGHVIGGVSDNQIWGEDAAGHGFSPYKDFASAGIDWDKAAKGPNSRPGGCETIRTLLTNSVPKDGVRTKPGLFVLDSCPNWIALVPTLQRDPKNPTDVLGPCDHMNDATRYRLAWEPMTIEIKHGAF